MLTIFAFVALVFEVAVFSRLDRRRFGTWITPFNVLAYPYAVVVLLILLFGPALGFVPVFGPSLFIWIVGLLLFWASGNFLSWALLDYKVAMASNQERWTDSDDTGTVRTSIAIGWITVPIILYGLMSAVGKAGGWIQFGTEEFRESYSHGLHAHAEVIAALMVIALIGLYRRGEKLKLATIAVLTILVALSRSKGHIMEIMLGGILFRFFSGVAHVSWKTVLVIVCVSYMAFTSAYILGASVVNPTVILDSGMYSILARHFFFYMSAGPLALSEAVRSGISDVGGPWYSIFAPAINLYRATLGIDNMIEAGSTHGKGMVTGLVGNAEVGVNVYTFFGTPYLYLGACGAIFYILVVGMCCYGLLVIVKSKKNTWLTAAYCFVAGQLALGFFENYFWYLTTYEILVLGFMLAYFGRLIPNSAPARVSSARANP